MVYKRNKNTKKSRTIKTTPVLRNNHRQIREKLCHLLKTTEVRIFKNDPISWIPQNHICLYKREISWHLYEMTHLLNLECWGIITDILFQQHSRSIFSLIYQLSKATYIRSTLPLLTAPHENYSIIKKIASIYRTNIILYKPNYIPQYLRVNTHYMNLITSNRPNSKKTMIVYSQPIECLYSMDYNFQLGALTDLRYEEQVHSFFDMSKCLIDFEDFDNCGDMITEQEQQQQHDSMILFKHRFDTSVEAKYKTFVALWCESENSKSIPDAWWPYPDNRALTVQEFVLLLIKVSTTHPGTGVIIYKSNYYCVCGDSYQADMMVCELHDDGELSIPSNFLRSDLNTKYKRRPLVSLVNEHKSLYVM